MKLLELLRELVAIPSVNPSYGGPGEKDVEKYVVNYIEALGLEARLQTVLEGRKNVLTVLGDKELPATVIEAHMDTVGVAGWKTGSPYDLTREGDRYYGRGSCDTKASLAVFLTVLTHFAHNPDSLKKRLVFAATVDEEANQTGAYELAKLFPELGVAAAISGEPTRSNIVMSHKGACRYRIIARGKAAHGSTPHLGSNAIVKASAIVRDLNDLASTLGDAKNGNELERGTLNVGKIKGGIGFNIVPDECVIEVDRRVGLNESIEKVASEIQEIVDGYEDVVLESALVRPALNTGFENAFSKALSDASEEVGANSEMKQVSYMTNAVAYEEAGVSALVFGPGDIEQAHKIDEFIEEGEMERAVEILVAYFSS